MAWIIGWDLILEYAVGNIAVAVSWSGYFQELLRGFGLHIPAWLGTSYYVEHHTAGLVESAPKIFGIPIVFNLPAVLTGIVPYRRLGVAEPLALAFSYIHLDWAAGIVSFGAVIATTAVLLVFQLGQPRILFAMSRDGLLPAWFSKVHPRFRTPHVTTILTGVAVGVFAAFMDIGEAAELTNIGTLFAFVLVCAGIPILRRQRPDQRRAFKTPLVPLVPLLGIFNCAYLMYNLPGITWVRFVVWLGLGMIVYFSYGRHHSQLRR